MTQVIQHTLFDTLGDEVVIHEAIAEVTPFVQMGDLVGERSRQTGTQMPSRYALNLVRNRNWRSLPAEFRLNRPCARCDASSGHYLSPTVTENARHVTCYACDGTGVTNPNTRRRSREYYARREARKAAAGTCQTCGREPGKGAVMCPSCGPNTAL